MQSGAETGAERGRSAKSSSCAGRDHSATPGNQGRKNRSSSLFRIHLSPADRQSRRLGAKLAPIPIINSQKKRLAQSPAYRIRENYLTEQSGIGAPSSCTGATGLASAVYAQNIPTIRNNILTARFMDCFS